MELIFGAEFWKECLICLPLIFLAGFVDSVAGGGGVISIPAYLLAGLPVHYAYGTNKFVMSFGTGTAALRFLKSGKVPLRPALFSALGAGAAATVCTLLTLNVIPERVYEILLLIILPAVAVFMVTRRDFGGDDASPKELPVWKTTLLSAMTGIVIGGYDGLIGPGTGLFLIIAFVSLLGMNLLTASGCAKIANFASGLASMIVCIAEGKIRYLLAIPCIAVCMLGNYLGARYAIRGGSKNVRKVMFVVLGLLFVKMLLSLCGIGF